MDTKNHMQDNVGAYSIMLASAVTFLLPAIVASYWVNKYAELFIYGKQFSDVRKRRHG